jgi:hypothetical protein
MYNTVCVGIDFGLVSMIFIRFWSCSDSVAFFVFQFILSYWNYVEYQY